MEAARPRLTVVETIGYLSDATTLFTDEERQAVVDMVATDPACGEVMKGCGGARKVRFALQGRGKSGGARIVYLFHNEGMPAFLLAVFAKNEKANLSKAEQNAMQRVCKAIVSNYGKKGG